MKKEKQVFKGRLLNVFVRKERLPNGYLAHLEVIKHPGAALIIPFVAKDKVILLKQLRAVIKAYIYELPAGTLDKNEASLSCAKREIIEETGFSASKFTKLGAIYPVPGYSTEKIVIYKAEGLRKVERRVEADEIIESKILTKKEVKDLFRKGKMTDAKTIAAFAMCGWL